MKYTALDVDSQSPLVAQHLRRIDEGGYGLPEFQRTFVWNQDQILSLWDSLYCGFPVGQLMLWEPAEVDFPMRAFGREQEEVKLNGSFTAVIDGQQRLTALYLVLIGEIPLRFDLVNRRFTFVDAQNSLRLDILRTSAGVRIPFVQAQGRQYFTVHASPAQKEEFGIAIDYLNGILNQRQIPSQIIRRADYPTALDVFKRLNRQGERLNEAQLTMAEISRHWPGVFRHTYQLLKRMNIEMGYDQADDPTFVFLIWTAVHTNQHLIRHLAPEEGLRSKYEKLAKKELYEKSWEKTSRGVSKLIEVMRDELNLTNFRFIKAYYPLAVAGHYLATHPNPSTLESGLLRRWLILSIVSGRYHERSQSKYAADVKSTIETKDLQDLFGHRIDALNPDVALHKVISPEQLVDAGWKTAYVTLLYLIVRRLNATDWRNYLRRVGDPLPVGTWHFHHIFPDERFDGDRARLRKEEEEADEQGDEQKVRQIRERKEALEQRITSIGNLAFLTPETNISIGARSPWDYLRELDSTKEGRDALDAQLIPRNQELWKEASFDNFRRERCKLISAKAKALFFMDAQ